ncbi:MAG: TIGR02391 family protein [Acidobacteria bacterium]|nr:TIGR02391 family protein [Acidobacteriota bacterium]
MIEKVNRLLAFEGLKVTDAGVLTPVPKASTVSEAQARASRLRQELLGRKVHPDVLAFCRAELLQDDYFHAVLEATKSVAEKIRRRTGLVSDGAELVDAALGGNRPVLALNSLQSDAERSEQRGFTNLIKGFFGTCRNPTAHAPRIYWPIDELDAIDLLTLASYLHRRIDAAVPARWTP